MRALIRLAIFLAGLIPALAFGQGAVLQGGTWQSGHLGVYSASQSQAVLQDAGGAQGGGVGTGVSELGIIARGTGTPPYDAQGTGPLGTVSCIYDAPITNATGYHYLCFSANVGGHGLIAYGNAGLAAAGSLKFNINGTAVTPVNCSGAPTAGFTVVNGIVTAC